jgi:hypothetical protein
MFERGVKRLFLLFKSNCPVVSVHKRLVFALGVTSPFKVSEDELLMIGEVLVVTETEGGVPETIAICTEVFVVLPSLDETTSVNRYVRLDARVFGGKTRDSVLGSESEPPVIFRHGAPFTVQVHV